MERELSSSMSKLTEIPFTEDNADSDNEESIQQREVEPQDAEQLVNKISLESLLSTTEVAYIELLTSLYQRLLNDQIWARSFVDCGGVDELLNDLASVFDGNLKIVDEQSFDILILKCLKYLTDIKIGLGAVLSAENGIKKLALGVLFPTPEVQRLTVQILTVVCLMPRMGQGAVIEALTFLQENGLERERFLSIVTQLGEATSVEVQVIYLSFLNTLIASSTDGESRHALRNELHLLGLTDAVQKLKDAEGSDELRMQINVYEEESILDHRARNNSLA